MKITLDITRLLKEKKITPKEYNKLLKLSANDLNASSINILAAFGVLAVVAAVIALKPSLLLATFLSVLVLMIGFGVLLKYKKNWEMLGNVLLMTGSIGLASDLFRFFEGHLAVFFIISLMYLIMSFIANSSLLAALSVLAVSPLIGMGSGYDFASYFLFVEKPLVTILVFSLLAVISFFISTRVNPVKEKLAIVFCRTSLILVNLGFWVGSLGGDRMLHINHSDVVFTVFWAVGILTAGIWATLKDRRYLVNLSAVFGAIHFYTQWFERLGAEPISVLSAGLIALVIAVALWKFNSSGLINKRR
jgi:hypothetical protein